MCVDLKVRSKVVKYITGDHYCVNSQTEKKKNPSYEMDFKPWQSNASFLQGHGRSEAGWNNVFGLTRTWSTAISKLQT